MDNKEESKKLDHIFNQIQDKLAEGLSKFLRSIDTKEKRLYALTNMKKTPSIESLKRVHEIGIKNEDYETCDAITEFCKNNGMKL